MAAVRVASAGTLSATVHDADGQPVAQAVVYARPVGHKAPAGPRRPARMDQIDKEFVPLVVPVQVGAAVSFPNKDNIRHHVYSFSPAKRFELKLYSGVPAKPVVFDRPGPVTLGCNIHDWMVGYIYVVDTPWFGKTSADGVASFELPAGDYVVKVWHPWMKAEPAAQHASVTGAQAVPVQFGLDVVQPPSMSKDE